MSQMKIMGNCAVLTSTLKLEDIRKLQQIAPDKTQIVDENGTVVYVIGVGITANMSIFGATFNAENSDGFATLTVTIPSTVEPNDRNTYITNRMEACVVAFNQYENAFQTRIESTLAQHEAFVAAIEVLD